MSLLLCDFLYSSSNLLVVLFTASLKPGWYTALTTQNTTENNCILSHAQNATVYPLNLCCTGIFQLLVMGKGWSAFPSIHHCSSELQISQSFPVVLHMGADNTDILVLCNL